MPSQDQTQAGQSTRRSSRAQDGEPRRTRRTEASAAAMPAQTAQAAAQEEEENSSKFSKSKGLLLAFRGVQALGGLTFIIFWSWACKANFVIQGTGDWFIGFWTAFTVLPICGIEILAFVKKCPDAADRPNGVIFCHRTWARDLALAGPWIVLVQNIMMPNGMVTFLQQNNVFADSVTVSSPSRDVVRHALVVITIVMGVSFFLTGLISFVDAVRNTALVKADEETGPIVQDNGRLQMENRRLRQQMMSMQRSMQQR